MNPRSLFGYAAAALALVTLVLSAYEGVRRFTKPSVLELLFAISSFATALVCIALVDWAFNLGRRAGRPDEEEPDEDLVAASRLYTAGTEGEAPVRSALLSLERLANEELGAEKTLDEAIKVVADFASASGMALWMLDEAGQPKLRARFADGQVATDPDPSAESVDPRLLQEVIEHRKLLQSAQGNRGDFLVPLLGPRGCIGVLRVAAPVAGSDEERASAAQRLSADLGLLARPFARAVRAPDLYDQAVIEPLTGLYTKRHFINRLTEATGASRRYGEPLSLILMDIDSFKLINGSYGPATGDRVLKTLAALVQENIREVDSSYRYGPDEFAMILPDTDADRAAVLAERLRRAVRGSRTLAADGGAILSSVSIGVAEFDEDMRGIGTLLARAEEALYAAKAAGHDRVERWREGTSAAVSDEAD